MQGDASNWYWAIKHAGSDAWGTCPARRIAQWYTRIGQPAYWYFWQHVADGPNGCGGAHHANEQPFVFHVLSETPGENQEDKGHYHIVRSYNLLDTPARLLRRLWCLRILAGFGLFSHVPWCCTERVQPAGGHALDPDRPILGDDGGHGLPWPVVAALQHIQTYGCGLP